MQSKLCIGFLIDTVSFTFCFTATNTGLGVVDRSSFPIMPKRLAFRHTAQYTQVFGSVQVASFHLCPQVQVVRRKHTNSMNKITCPRRLSIAFLSCFSSFPNFR